MILMDCLHSMGMIMRYMAVLLQKNPEYGKFSGEGDDVEDKDYSGTATSEASSTDSQLNIGQVGEDERFLMDMYAPVLVEEEDTENATTDALARTPRDNLAEVSNAERLKCRQNPKNNSRNRSLEKARATQRHEHVTALSLKKLIRADWHILWGQGGTNIGEGKEKVPK